MKLTELNKKVIEILNSKGFVKYNPTVMAGCYDGKIYYNISVFLHDYGNNYVYVSLIQDVNLLIELFTRKLDEFLLIENSKEITDIEI